MIRFFRSLFAFRFRLGGRGELLATWRDGGLALVVLCHTSGAPLWVLTWAFARAFPHGDED